MDFDFRNLEFSLDRSNFRKMTESSDGEVGRDLYRRGQLVAFLAARDAPKKTGALAESIEVTFLAGRNPSVLIGSTLDYAYLIHEGTEPHLIPAKPGRMLRFVINGRVVYAQEVNHPGTDANPFLERHLRKVLND